MNNDLWIVYDNEEGLVIQTDDYEKAVEEYEKQKAHQRQYAVDSGEFDENATVILAKVEKIMYPYDTGTLAEASENQQTYWDWKELNLANKKGE